ncbi:hypothetical protein [Legionella yabuuchiae]|uniref:hypothetical protein n=1 Tax=Legionella yabuuchiae TaxID=376727 RepID=UPI001055F487|nr:hypothetical protein [Legionella yabuuchiae]
MIWISQLHLWIALTATLILMLFHYLSPWFADHLPGRGKIFVSFAGGTAVAYVFLHMLPELVEYNEPIGRFLVNQDWLTPFTELTIYIVALIGFLVYYGLELTAERYQQAEQNYWLVYGLHLGMFCLYNFLITYTMSLRVQESLSATILFTFSMALHFVLTDRKFSRLYRNLFNHLGRFILISFLFLGWLFSVIFDPVNVVVAAFMVAFLAGSVLLNVFREELPVAGLANYRWFLYGSGIITIILLLQTWSAVNLNF